MWRTLLQKAECQVEALHAVTATVGPRVYEGVGILHADVKIARIKYPFASPHTNHNVTLRTEQHI